MSFADELRELALTAPKERDTEDAFNDESTAKLAAVSAEDYDESLLGGGRASHGTGGGAGGAPKIGQRLRGAEELTSDRYAGKMMTRAEKQKMLIEDEQFPDEQFELDPDLYDIRTGSDDGDEADEEEGSGNEEDVDEEADDDDMASEDELHEDEEEEEDIGSADEEDEGSSDEDEMEGHGDDIDISSFVQKSKESSATGQNGTSSNKFNDLENSVVQKFSGGAVDVSEDVRKGRCIGHQLKIWDKLLEYRIQLQRVLALANQLPPHDVYGPVMKEFLAADADNLRLYQQSVKNVERAFGQLAAIRAQLVDMFPEMKKSFDKAARGEEQEDDDDDDDDDDEEIPSDIASGYSEDEDAKDNARSKKLSNGATKRKADEMTEDDEAEKDEVSQAVKKRKKFHAEEVARENDEFHDNLVPFRNATVDKWYQRTKLGSGSTGQQRKGYTALEQPPLTQIANILADRERLLERTRTQRSQYRIVGLPQEEQDQSASAGTADSGGGAGTVAAKRILPEIFDDDDFYHHLLREVIERKTQDVSDPAEVSRHWIEIQKLRSKIKRRVDTKASKGRRIRYDVIPKLVSFMTPHDPQGVSEQAKNDLFSSIFGKRLTATATKSADVRSDITKKDLAGFKLFA